MNFLTAGTVTATIVYTLYIVLVLIGLSLVFYGLYDGCRP